MSKKIKSYLQIDNKFLGTLLYFKDKNDRGCLKLSFKNKITDLVKGTDIPTMKPVPLKSSTPVSLDISYKFQDSFLEVKKVINGKTEREFYNIPLPITTYLFIIKIKNWHLLDDAKQSNSPLILIPPSQNDSVAIVFSFLNINGEPIAPKEYSCTMGTIDLPENPLNKFCIGIVEDRNNTDISDFIIKMPKTKI